MGTWPIRVGESEEHRNRDIGNSHDSYSWDSALVPKEESPNKGWDPDLREGTVVVHCMAEKSLDTSLMGLTRTLPSGMSGEVVHKEVQQLRTHYKFI